eukprot:PhF_6_TR8880/c0_g1_i1/m.14049
MSEEDLCKAASHGDEILVTNLLSRGVKPDSRFRGQTALMFASEFGHDRIATLLIQNGSNVDLMDTYGRSALHLACRHSHVAVTKVLLEYGATGQLSSSTFGVGETPVDVVKLRGNLDMLRLVVFNQYTLRPEVVAKRDRQNQPTQQNETAQPCENISAVKENPAQNSTVPRASVDISSTETKPKEPPIPTILRVAPPAEFDTQGSSRSPRKYVN